MAFTEHKKVVLNERLEGKKNLGSDVDHLSKLKPGVKYGVLNPPRPKSPPLPKLKGEQTRTFNIKTHSDEKLDFLEMAGDIYGRFGDILGNLGSRFLDTFLGDKFKKLALPALGAAAAAGFFGWKASKFLGGKLIGAFAKPFKGLWKLAKKPFSFANKQLKKSARRMGFFKKPENAPKKGIFRSALSKAGGAIKGVAKLGGRIVRRTPVGLVLTVGGVAAYKNQGFLGNTIDKVKNKTGELFNKITGKTKEVLETGGEVYHKGHDVIFEKTPEFVQSENPFNKTVENMTDRLPALKSPEFAHIRRDVFGNGLDKESKDLPKVPSQSALEDYFNFKVPDVNE